MGFFSKIFDFLGVSGHKVNVLVVGLDNSGKSTIIEKLKPKARQVPEVAPTVGFSVDEFQKGGISFTVYDMSGAGRYRPLWEQYYKDADAIIFVIDSADKLRLVVAKDELENMLQNTSLNRVPILFFSNKTDLPTAMRPVEIAQSLQLENIKDRPWQILPSNALTGEGLDKGTEWLAESVMRRH